MLAVFCLAPISVLTALLACSFFFRRTMPQTYYSMMAGGMLLAKWSAIVLLTPVVLLMSWREARRLPPIRSKLLLRSGTVLAEMIRTKQVTSEEVVRAYVDRAREVNPVLNAVVEDRFEEALEEARAADRLVQSGQMSVEDMARNLPLLGVPVTIKESIAVKGCSNGAGQVREVGRKAAEDAQVVLRVREAGAIVLLVSNTPELCMNLETVNKVTGRTLNPHDTRRSPGGSSGGEAALLSSAASVLGIGSDIGGSMRIPAAFTGVFGHKPTPGVISICGHTPSSADKLWTKLFTIGPMTRYAEDLVLMTRVLASESAQLLRLDEPVDLTALNIYFMEDDGGSIISDNVSPQIKQAMRKVLNHFQSNHKTQIKQMHLPGLNSVVQLTVPLFFMDGVTNIFQNESHPKEGRSVFFELLKFITGCSKLSNSLVIYGVLKSLIDKVTTQRVKNSIAEDNIQLRKHLQEFLGPNTVLLYPTFVSSATRHGEMFSRVFNAHYTCVFNVLEVPATSCPVGLDNKGLPIGIQVVAGPNHDRLCFAVAREIERAFGGWIQPPMVEHVS